MVQLPLRCQNNAGRLSVWLRTVLSLMSKCWARMSKWMSPPASSKSEIEMVPWGLEDVMRACWICKGHSWRQTRGVWDGFGCLDATSGVGNQAPPQPFPDASWYPRADGRRGINSAIRVGRDDISVRIHWKSARAAWTPLFSATRVDEEWERANWRELKRPRAPGRAMAMLRNSPSTLCHFFFEIRRCVDGMEDRISARRCCRWSGSWMVMDTVLTSQPRTVLHVVQDTSPCLSFFRLTGSRRARSSQ